MKSIKLTAATFLAAGYTATAQSTNVVNLAQDIKANFDYVVPFATSMAVIAVGVSAAVFWMRKGSKGRA